MKKILMLTAILFAAAAVIATASPVQEKETEKTQEQTRKPVEARQASGDGLSTGPANSIIDVPGIEVGNYDEQFTGTTVILSRNGAVGGVDVRGSAPGSRETDLLDPTNLVNSVNAVVLFRGQRLRIGSGGRSHALAGRKQYRLARRRRKRRSDCAFCDSF